MLDLVSVISGQLTYYRHKKCVGTLADTIGADMLKSFYLCNEFLARYGVDHAEFANNNYLAGNCHYYCLGVLKHGPAHSDFSKVREYVIEHAKITSLLFVLNAKIASGEYIQIPEKRIQDEQFIQERRGGIQAISGVAKQASVALALSSDKSSVIDIGAGYGAVVKAVSKLGLSHNLRKYTAIEPDINKSAELSKVIRDYAAANDKQYADFQVIAEDFNSIHPMRADVYLSYNSSYFLNYNILHELLNDKNRFHGIAMMSDNLFFCNDQVKAKDFNVRYDVAKNLITGRIGNLDVLERPLVTSMFPSVYPLKFMHPYKMIDINLQHPFLQSFAYVSNLQPRAGANIEMYLVKPIMLINCGMLSKFFSRPTMHKLTGDDFNWYELTGCYVSPKLNGVAAMLYQDGGIWKIALRRGQIFIPYTYTEVDGVQKPLEPYCPTKSIEYDKFYIELVMINKRIYPFFLSLMPKKSTERGKKQRRLAFWGEKWANFNVKMGAIRGACPWLCFKDYFFLEKGFESPSEILLDFNKKAGVALPSDGLIFTDVLGNYSSFWKPLNTHDIQIDIPDGVPLAIGMGVPVHDPRGVCIIPGIYECLIRNDRIVVGCYRADKLKASNMLDCVDEIGNYLHTEIDGKARIITIGEKKITMRNMSAEMFAEGGVTGPYECVFRHILTTRVPVGVLKSYMSTLRKRLYDSQPLIVEGTNALIPVSVLVHILHSLVPGVDPYHLWSHMALAGFAQTYPNVPNVRDFGSGFLPAFQFKVDYDFTKIEEYPEVVINMNDDPQYALEVFDGKYRLTCARKMKDEFVFSYDGRIYHARVLTFRKTESGAFIHSILF